MVNNINPSKCCGCSACYCICPYNAIEMLPDTLGFLYPHIDKNKCTNCGLCERVCSFNSNYETKYNLPYPLAYAARNKDLDEVKKSRSGAVFAALSDYILNINGIVYGAGYENGFRVCHKRAKNHTEMDEFRGSKYVQSNLGIIFKQIKSDLRSGLPVLFSGTPCQTAGLRSYLGDNLLQNLYLVDIVCHGTSSPKVWLDYLAYIKDLEKKNIISVNFRNKILFGWKAHKETFTFEDGKTKWYKYRFYNDIHIRKSCNSCPFANTVRPSDITIGDFWGYEKTVPTMHKDNFGCSMVYCNTNKGISLFNMINKNLYVTVVNISITLQPNLIRPTQIHRNRDAFEKTYKTRGFEYTAKRYGLIGWRYYWDKIIGIIHKKIS